jgi:hypothetical protein
MKMSSLLNRCDPAARALRPFYASGRGFAPQAVRGPWYLSGARRAARMVMRPRSFVMAGHKEDVGSKNQLMITAVAVRLARSYWSLCSISSG